MNGYPVYVLNNHSNVSTINPFPVSLTSGTNSIGAVSILQDGTLVTKTNPLPVVLNSNAITVTGSVTIPATVTVSSSSNDPVHVHLEHELPTGSNYIGSVSISSPIPLSVKIQTDSNTIGTVNIQTSNNTTIPVTLQTASNYIGSVSISSPNPLPVSFTLPTASNTIGTVNIQTSNNTTIPVTLQTASNYIGSVSISSPNPLPVSFTLPTASNVIGYVNILNNGSNITSNNPLQVQLVANTAINPSSNTLGSVNILTNYSNVTNQNPVITQPSSMLLDAFGRNRVSDCFTLGEYKHVYNIDPNFTDLTSNGGSITFVKNKACATLATSNTSNAMAIHQTRLYHHYMPGKSHLILSSFCFGAWQSNVTKRTGYYDDYDGIYFEQSGSNGLLSVNILSQLNGLNSVSQSNWNIDPLNGSGPSKINLDITKTQLIFIDFQWLGVGRVRCGFAIGGNFINCHEFYHSNKLSTVYISNPSLPIRCQIFNIGPSSGGSLDQICSTVISEGGYIENGIDYAINSPIVILPGVQFAALPVICIKLANTFNGYLNRAVVRLNNIQVLSLDQPISYNVLKLDTSLNVIGGSWSNVDTNSAVQYNASATGISGSLTNALSSSTVAAGGNGVNIYGSVTTSTGSSARRNFIAQNIQSTDSQVYAIYCSNLAITNNNNTARVIVSLQWREVY
mgnify:CR=1 FL=1